MDKEGTDFRIFLIKLAVEIAGMDFLREDKTKKVENKEKKSYLEISYFLTSLFFCEVAHSSSSVTVQKPCSVSAV